MLRIAFGTCLLSAVAMFLPAPFEAAAKSFGGHGARASHAGGGHGARGFHARTHHGAHLYGGFASWPYYAPDYTGNGQSDAIVLPPPEPPYRLTCRQSWEAIDVLSEDGGVGKIGITRC